MLVMAAWDDEGFEPGDLTENRGDAWEGEDEDDIKENWDDEEAEQDKPPETAATATVKKKKSTVKQKILEKEEKIKQEVARKAAMKEQEDEEVDEDEESIFASKMAEKVKNQKLVEESDLEVAKDLFDGGGDIETDVKSLDTFKPTNKDEFTEFAKMLTEKLSQFESSVEYLGFLELFLRDLASGLEADDVKKLASVLNALATEKQRALKATKGKKKGKKAVLGGSTKGTKGVDLADYSTYGDEFDDYL